MVSVVIPARNAADVLPLQLAALSRQNHDYEWEVIVVDNGSTDGTERVASAWSDRLPIRVMSAQDRPGVSYARNTGARSARGDLLAFCDADDEVSKDWLASLVDASRCFDAVGGATDIARLNDAVSRSWNSAVLTEHTRMAGKFLPAVGAGNLSLWTDVFLALGGFNEDYAYGAEDIEFCWRLQLAGYRLGFSKDALIHVRTRRYVLDLARQFYSYGRASPKLFRDFHAEGMPRSSVRDALKSWGWLILHLPDLLRNRRLRGAWVRVASMRIGKVMGSVRNRVVYL